MTVKERLAVGWKNFLKFLYNRETSEILGRTFFSWTKISTFYVVFYLFFTGIFAIHLSVFLAFTPHPGQDITPWNFGKYAYPNYPNSKIALVSVPKTITYKQGSLVVDEEALNSIKKLNQSATASGVNSNCLNANTKHGYDVNKPCVFLHVAKVFEWTPNLINESLDNQQSLPIKCTLETSQNNLAIDITSNQVGLPLNLNNNNNATSFPYSGQVDYSTPVMAVMLNLTSLPAGLPNKFSASLSCGIDFVSLGMTQPSLSALNRLYEIPEVATVKLNFRL